MGIFSPLGLAGRRGQEWVLSAALSAADLPGGTVQSAGKPRQQPSCPRGGRLADQELPDVQGPRHQGPVPTEMARHRRQRPPGSQELRKFGDFLVLRLLFSRVSDERLVCPFPPEESSIGQLLPFVRQATSSALAWVLCCS